MQQHLPFTVLKQVHKCVCDAGFDTLQQWLPFMVCAVEYEVAEEQSDDESHTLQVPERSEGKDRSDKGIVLTVYSIETIPL